jgi:hypothetical protein
LLVTVRDSSQTRFLQAEQTGEHGVWKLDGSHKFKYVDIIYRGMVTQVRLLLIG